MLIAWCLLNVCGNRWRVSTSFSLYIWLLSAPPISQDKTLSHSPLWGGSRALCSQGCRHPQHLCAPSPAPWPATVPGHTLCLFCLGDLSGLCSSWHIIRDPETLHVGPRFGHGYGKNFRGTRGVRERWGPSLVSSGERESAGRCPGGPWPADVAGTELVHCVCSGAAWHVTKLGTALMPLRAFVHVRDVRICATNIGGLPLWRARQGPAGLPAYPARCPPRCCSDSHVPALLLTWNQRPPKLSRSDTFIYLEVVIGLRI